MSTSAACLAGERGLALRQDDDAGDELDRARARGDEPEQHERLVKRLRGVVVLADHVVERDDVLEALVLGRRRELADRAGVVADLVLREDDADLHAGIVSRVGCRARSRKACTPGSPLSSGAARVAGWS